MLIAIALTAAMSAAVNIMYFKSKRDKLLFPVSSAVIFAVLISVMLFPKLKLLSFIKCAAVLSLLHICSTNDIIRHQSDDIFPAAIIVIGLIAPDNILYMAISFAVISVMFVIIIISSKSTLGGGDIKMICALSFFFGITISVKALIISCIAGILYAIAAKFAAKLPDFNKHFAFLPFVEVGYSAAILIQLY